MAVRDILHKRGRTRHVGVFASFVVSAVLAGCVETGAQASEGASATPSSTGSGESTEEAPSRALPPAGYAWVIFGSDTVVAEVAATPEERAEGLMYRDDVPDGTGMLFVFEDSRPRAFWMANTYVPLDIAYMDPSYRIVDIVAMEPLVTDSYPSDAPAMFGLEVRQGWFEEHEIGIGARADIVFGVQGR